MRQDALIILLNPTVRRAQPDLAPAPVCWTHKSLGVHSLRDHDGYVL